MGRSKAKIKNYRAISSRKDTEYDRKMDAADHLLDLPQYQKLLNDTCEEEEGQNERASSKKTEESPAAALDASEVLSPELRAVAGDVMVGRK